MDIALMGVGAGAKGAITGLVGKFLPGVSEDIGAIIVGALMYRFGDRLHPMLQKIGVGVLIAGIGQMTSGFIEGLVPGGSSGGSSGNPGTQYTSVQAMAEAESRKTVSTGVVIR